MKTRLYLKIPIICASLVLGAATLHAQATRTWVSGVGDDANPCSRTAPCKTFAGAISKTAPGGEINVLDPGGFGGVTITKAITISSTCFEAGVLVSGTPGITVAAGPNDRVILEGLDIYGLGTGTNGVNFASGLVLIIRNSKILYFANQGVNVASNTANARVVIQNCLIAFNGTSGNGNTGGVAVQGNGVANAAVLIDTVLEANLNYGLQVTGLSNLATFTRSFVNPTGIVSVNNGKLFSVGPSNFFASGAPNQAVLTFQ
jgi:hypothetical protein